MAWDALGDGGDTTGHHAHPRGWPAGHRGACSRSIGRARRRLRLAAPDADMVVIRAPGKIIVRFATAEEQQTAALSPTPAGEPPALQTPPRPAGTPALQTPFQPHQRPAGTPALQKPTPGESPALPRGAGHGRFRRPINPHRLGYVSRAPGGASDEATLNLPREVEVRDLKAERAGRVFPCMKEGRRYTGCIGYDRCKVLCWSPRPRERQALVRVDAPAGGPCRDCLYAHEVQGEVAMLNGRAVRLMECRLGFWHGRATIGDFVTDKIALKVALPCPGFVQTEAPHPAVAHARSVARRRSHRRRTGP